MANAITPPALVGMSPRPAMPQRPMGPMASPALAAGQAIRAKSMPAPPAPAPRSAVPSWLDQAISGYEQQRRAQQQGTSGSKSAMFDNGGGPPSFGSQLRGFANYYYGQQPQGGPAKSQPPAARGPVRNPWGPTP